MTSGNNVFLRKNVLELIQCRLQPGEDISDWLEQLINSDEELRGYLRALYQALGMTVLSKRNVVSKQEGNSEKHVN
jgi:hypothetical protein